MFMQKFNFLRSGKEVTIEETSFPLRKKLNFSMDMFLSFSKVIYLQEFYSTKLIISKSQF